MMSKPLRGGYTTGACVAAGAKAAALYMKKKECLSLEIMALDGTILTIPVKDIQPVAKGVRVEIVKDSGDDPDITNGVSIFTTLIMKDDGKGIRFEAGEGIGHVTKAGLSVSVGEPAINPGPRKLISNVLHEEFGEAVSCIVRIDIPGGQELAKKTLNPILGVLGGISIIGTTGVLRPMSEEGFKNSLTPQIDVAKAAGFNTQIFVPGKIGERIATSWGLPTEAVVQTSNFIGFMLEAAVDRELDRVLLFGHIGKLAKVAAGVFHTHNRVGDGRMEAIAAYSGALGMPQSGIQQVLAANTTEDALPIIEKYNCTGVYDVLCQRATYRAQRLIFNKLQVGTVMVTLKGELLGMDHNAREIGGDLGWSIKL